MIQTCPSPDRRRMILIFDRAIAALGDCLATRGCAEIRGHVQDPVCGVQELRSFQNHLHDMLVTMPARTARCLVGKIEDVHRWGYLKPLRRPALNFTCSSRNRQDSSSAHHLFVIPESVRTLGPVYHPHLVVLSSAPVYCESSILPYHNPPYLYDFSYSV